jgi:hypothetical protein
VTRSRIDDSPALTAGVTVPVALVPSIAVGDVLALKG